MDTAQPAVDIPEVGCVRLVRQDLSSALGQRQFLLAEILGRESRIQRTAECAVGFGAQQRLSAVAQILNVPIDPPVPEKERRLEGRIVREQTAGTHDALRHQPHELPVRASKSVRGRWKLLQMAGERGPQIGERLKVLRQERFDVARIGRSKCRPAGSCQNQLPGRHGRRLVEQCRHLGRIELAQAAERIDARVRIDADHAQPRAGELGACEPVEDLEDLKLIEQIVLEPEDDLAIARGGRKMLVPEAEVAQHLVVAEVRPGQMGGSQLRRRRRIETGRKRAVDHRVAPRQYVVVGEQLLQRARGDVAIGHMQARTHTSPSLTLQYRASL